VAAVRQSWAIALHVVLRGMPDVLVGQLVPGGETYELVLTTRQSPPPLELVDALRERLGSLVGREDSPTTTWHFYPAHDDGTRELFARLDWSHAVVLHEFVD
jgi:hypothetical protein